MRFAPALVLLAACGAAPAADDQPVALPRAHATAPRVVRTTARASDAELLDAANAALAHGDKELARADLVELVEKWPTSPLRSLAYATLGDLAFEQPDDAHQEEAERDYREAAAAAPPDNRVYGYAFYKLAYVLWNRGDAQAAIACLARTIDFGARYPQVAGAAKLRDVALRDVIPIFARVGSPSRAFAFFLRLSGERPRARAMLRELEQIYARDGKAAEAQAARESEAYASGRIK